jgi:hypothetical protein
MDTPTVSGVSQVSTPLAARHGVTGSLATAFVLCTNLLMPVKVQVHSKVEVQQRRLVVLLQAEVVFANTRDAARHV